MYDNYEKAPGENDLIEAFFEDQEDELDETQQITVRRIQGDQFLKGVVMRMMAWSYEQAMRGQE